LYTQDWIETLPRKGVIVSQHLPEIKPRTFKAVTKISGYTGNTGFRFHKPVSFYSGAAKAGSHRLIINDGFPDARIAPADLLLKEHRKLFHNPAIQRLVMFGNHEGSVNLRGAIAQFL
jgi:GntR family transcriptional regulator/MocR family aminotransferase